VYDKASGRPIEGLYEDLNRDGQITDADRYFLQNQLQLFCLVLTHKYLSTNGQ
jgi:hypothetical protein